LECGFSGSDSINPTQLDGFANPEINTYSVESIIAEKFDIMLQRLEFTSRMMGL
jgi:hypothetical protein